MLLDMKLNAEMKIISILMTIRLQKQLMNQGEWLS